MAVYKGFFKPKNPKKHKGDCTNIIYRSSYELKMMMYLDEHPNVLLWGSEEYIIPYRSPLDNKIHRYFVDFNVTLINNEGKKEMEKLYNNNLPQQNIGGCFNTLNEALEYFLHCREQGYT